MFAVSAKREFHLLPKIAVCRSSSSHVLFFTYFDPANNHVYGHGTPLRIGAKKEADFVGSM